MSISTADPNGMTSVSPLQQKSEQSEQDTTRVLVGTSTLAKPCQPGPPSPGGLQADALKQFAASESLSVTHTAGLQTGRSVDAAG